VHGVHDEKRVWFEVELQRAQGDREAEGFRVSNNDAAVAQRRVGADITVTGIPGQEGAEGNVAGRKKKRSKEAKLENLLKYKAWLIRWSLVRGSNIG
ncbi:hypothetical protein Tco_0692300, partial [Tanacetum coccineum]